MRLQIPQSFKRIGTSLQPLHLASNDGSNDGSSILIHVLDHNLIRVQHIPPGHKALHATHTINPATTLHVEESQQNQQNQQSHSDLKDKSQGQFLHQNDITTNVLGIQRSNVHHHFACPVPSFAVQPDGQSLVLKTNDVQLNINLLDSDISLSWTAASCTTTKNLPFMQDLAYRAYEYDLDGSVHHYLRHSSHTNYYGTGERASPLSLAGRHLSLSTTDALGYDPEHTDPLYKHVPVFYGVDSTTNQAYGVYYDSLATGSLDFGCEIDAIWGSFSSFRTSAPTLDYYVFYGPSMDRCVQTFASLVGYPAMIPKYALGYLASSMGYAESENAQELIEAFPTLCEKWDIPCDVLHLSSGYTVNESTGARNVFTWNSKRFPDPIHMFQTLRHSGIRTLANIKPWLLAGHPSYGDMADSVGFVWDQENNRPSVTRLWSSGAGSTAVGSYFDFSSKAGRDFWKEGVKSLLSVGVAGIWNDNNEFALHRDDHTYAMMGGDRLTVGQGGRALQTVLMASASFEAMLEHSPDTRPFLVTRSCSPGAHRFACQTWSGDNSTSWQTLQHNIPMGLNAGLCLMPGYGHDVGGFVGPRPDKELFVRWVQNGIFHPRFCIHSWKEQGITEPWMYPDVVHIIRDAIQFRYRLIPYLYTLHHNASSSGVPVIRPLLYHFQADSKTHQASFDYMLGPHLLVASVFVPGATERTVYLPSEQEQPTRWCNVWTGEWMAGGQSVTVAVPLEQHGALFARAGALIPTCMSMRYVGAVPDTTRQIDVYLDPSAASRCEYTIIDDDGVSENAPVLKYKVWAENTASGQVLVGVDVLEAGFVPAFSQLKFVLPINDHRDLATRGADGSIECGSTSYMDARRMLVVPLVL
ncbi:hypothetical protein BASA60_009293 [Batrachochytrium salamandrivorans]|nr:hypothetical protein BASA60_009293 [Batrachochytrium salamandrivorans]